jgi:transglutaminase-like putative cysteine protease
VIYSVVHNTTYEYADSAEACHNVVRLHPRTLLHQRCREMRLRIEPVPDKLHSYLDYFGNRVHSFAVYQPHAVLSITAESIVELAPREQELAPAPAWNDVADQLRTDRSEIVVAALDYVFASPYVAIGPRLRAFAQPHFAVGRSLCDAAYELTRAIHRDFKYDKKVTTVGTPVLEVLENRHGVCQDFAHLQIACLRSLGLAARYVSGYLRTDPQPGKPRLMGADASHAWVSVFCPANGWVDYDPTNGCLAGDRHVTLGWGRDFHDVSPVKGVVLGGGASQLRVAVDVLPV